MFSASRDERGRPTHYEIALANIHHGEWWYWTDNKNRIYENLRLYEKIWIDGKLVDNPYTLPTKNELDIKLAEVQAAWDIKYDSYKSKRKAEYPTIEELVVALYDTDDKSAIEAKRAEVKAKYPK